MSATNKHCQGCGVELTDGKAKQCPSCGAKIKKPIFKKWWFWVIVAVGAIILVSAAGGSGDEADVGADNSSNSTKYETVDLQQMLDDLEENALKAEKTYQGKYVKVTGKISNFDSDGSYISIEPTTADEWNFDTVMCYIKNDSQLDFLMEKSVGDTVTIKGKIISIGEIMGYSINIDEIN